ncbi:ABC transporter permease [Frateuria aurantia]
MPAVSHSSGTLGSAWQDLRRAWARREVWMTLGWQDIKQRYRRSMLGPLWITLTMLITICGLGPLYGLLFKLPVADFIPYLAMGIISWGLISNLILEGCQAYVGAERLIRSVNLPMSSYVLQLLYRNLIIYGHNLLAYVPVMLYFHLVPRWSWLLLLPGVALVMLAAFPAGLLLGMFCARFRDMQQIVSSSLQLVFFMTPVFWKPQLLGPGREAWVRLNPLYPFVEILRDPIYQGVPPGWVYAAVLLMTALLYAVAWPLFARSHRRIAFWV